MRDVDDVRLSFASSQRVERAYTHPRWPLTRSEARSVSKGILLISVCRALSANTTKLMHTAGARTSLRRHVLHAGLERPTRDFCPIRADGRWSSKVVTWRFLFHPPSMCRSEEEIFH